MHVGMSVIFQGFEDPARDREVYARELALADQAEGLGFDSIWAVEHHFTPYTMCPDPLQFLTYMAGRTKRVQLGSMVVVLPWHDPVRVAEHVTMLDVLSGGRFIFGMGRGLGRVEFGGFRVAMDESRSRFIECATAVLEGLDRGYVEFKGEHFDIPRRNLRPAPIATFRGRTYAAAVSPESVKIMAELGVGLLIIPQKPWAQVSAELEEYRTQYRAIRGEEPPAPIVAAWMFVDNDVNIMAVGEQWAGLGRSHENFIFIKVGTGIGCGIICRGEIYRGADGSAGDIGHIEITAEPVVCRCGNTGCLEAVAGGAALARAAQEAALEGRSSYLSKTFAEKGTLSVADVGLLLARGDPFAVDLVRSAGGAVGHALAGMVNFFNPSLVVIGGGVAKLGDIFLASIRETVYRRSLPLATRHILIQQSELGDSAGVIGAAAMVLAERFQLRPVGSSWGLGMP